MKKQLLMVLAISASLSTFAKTQPARARVTVAPNAKAVPLRQAQGGINEAPFNTNSSSGMCTSCAPHFPRRRRPSDDERITA